MYACNSIIFKFKLSNMCKISQILNVNLFNVQVYEFQSIYWCKYITTEQEGVLNGTPPITPSCWVEWALLNFAKSRFAIAQVYLGQAGVPHDVKTAGVCVRVELIHVSRRSVWLRSVFLGIVAQHGWHCPGQVMSSQPDARLVLVPLLQQKRMECTHIIPGAFRTTSPAGPPTVEEVR